MSFTVFVLALFIHQTLGSCPNIVKREDWGALPALTTPLTIHPATHVVLHHSSTPSCTVPANCAAVVRAIQKHHMNRKRYQDIGYNFLIGEDGNVYEGVGWGKKGTHDDRMDARSIGICMIGDYTSWLPNEEAESALEALIDCGVREGHISGRYKLIGHRQVKHTDCPGQKLYNHLKRLRNWSPSA